MFLSKTSFARHALLAGVLVLAAAAGSPSAFAQGTVKVTHGDWDVRCDTPPGAQAEQCALVQNVTAEDRDNVGLTMIVLQTADNQTRLMRVLAPLGVLLPSGLGLRIDNEEIGRTGFVRCLPNGCVAEVVLDEELVGKLRKGEQATFIVFQSPEQGIGIPVSLSGFSAGFDAVTTAN